MKTPSSLIATIIFGAGAALLTAAALSASPRLARWPTGLNATLFLCLAAYAVLLARASGRPFRALSAPFLMLLAVLPVASSVSGFLVPATAGLAWMRSGICFPGPVARRVVAETLTAAAGLILCGLLRPPGAAGWALGLWMFFLIQALYFVVIEVTAFPRSRLPLRRPRPALRGRADAFLREQKLERAFAELDLSIRSGSDT
jgi:hypothetical protein